MKELRTPKTYDKYQEDKEKGLNDTCFFCNDSRHKLVKAFEHWLIVENDYPYDAVASVSHIIFPKRHTKIDGLTPEEEIELKSIKSGYMTESKYDYVLEAVAKTSIPDHTHFHLIKLG